MKITNNFSKSEFESKDGSEMPLEVLENIKELAINLQVIRDFLDASITINSAYRSPSHNKKIGGSKNSQHLLGKASDITVNGYTPKEVYEAIDKLINAKAISQGGLGYYNTFTHYDIRGLRARW